MVYCGNRPPKVTDCSLSTSTSWIQHGNNLCHATTGVEGNSFAVRRSPENIPELRLHDLSRAVHLSAMVIVLLKSIDSFVTSAENLKDKLERGPVAAACL